MKTCKKCDQPKPFSSYTVDIRYKDGYYPWCFECRKAWRDARIEKQRELHAGWREKNREYVRKVGREYYQNNDGARKKNRDAGRIRDREAYKNNPEVKRRKDIQAAEKNRRRRALLYGIDTQHHTEQEWQDLCERYDHRCLCCGERKPLSRDHVIPVTSGGLDTIENIQPLCKGCNSKKNDKTIDYRAIWGGDETAP